MSDVRHNALQARINELEDLVEDLQSRINSMLALKTQMVFPPEWKLTRMESVMLQLMMKHTIMTRELVSSALYSQRNDPPNSRVIDAVTCHLRKKLDPYGIIIKTERGCGYHLDFDAKELIKRYLVEFTFRDLAASTDQSSAVAAPTQSM